MDRTHHIKITPMKSDEAIEGKAYVHWKAWQETYAGLMPQAYVDQVTLEKCRAWAHQWPQNTLVLKWDNQVIGFSCFAESQDSGPGKAGEVTALYLLEDYQGQGLGLALMRATMEELGAMPEVILWVLKGNEKAIRFYKGYGFQFDGTERSEAYGTELRMVLQRGKSR